MKSSHKFLKLYVKDLDVRDKEFAEGITLTGTKIETFERTNKNLENIVVAKIVKIEKHPDADKLLVCQVDVGNETLQIVTGAQNVYEGMLCPAVLHGGKVAASAHDNEVHEDGIRIKKGKLRGVESNGMLCSLDELGQNSDLYMNVEDGIFDLKDYNCKPGDDVVKVMGLDDTLYDFEITSNRIDCYSEVGIAREVAATFNKTLTLPDEKFVGKDLDKNYIKLTIENKELCPAFATRLVKNVKITESPEWMKEALRSVGIRPINNIVDITNFVMMEYGQPMHAYNYDTVRGKEIIVKCASDGDRFKTLDDVERVLDKNTLMICDKEGYIGIAGIMGGENSMITDDTNTLLFEAANFNGVNVRLSSKRLGLRTEASNLFEKGLDPNNAIKAINRAVHLIEEMGCGEVEKEMIYVYPDESKNGKKELVVDANRINNLLGINVDKNEMKKILDKIDLLTTIEGNNLKIEVPTIRKDIESFADVAEEIMRFVGYDKIGNTLPKINATPHLPTKSQIIEKVAYDIGIYNGFSEAQNYSFESEKVYDKLLYKPDAVERKYIKILNPLGDDFACMRTQLANGILNNLSTNYNRRNKIAKLFEVANVYLPKDGIVENSKINDLPDERKTLIMGGYGKDEDFYTFKGYAEEFLEALNIRKYKFERNENVSFMHPGRCADIFVDSIKLGTIGEVHEKVLNNYEIGVRTYMLIIDLNTIEEIIDLKKQYYEISKFPSVDRDLSMLVPKEISVAKIEEVIKKNGGKLLKTYELFDIYEGAQVKEGFKSIAYTISLGAMDHTLKDEEIDEVVNKVIKGLKDINIELRS